jgi:hypothetical protein
MNFMALVRLSSQCADQLAKAGNFCRRRFNETNDIFFESMHIQFPATIGNQLLAFIRLSFPFSYLPFPISRLPSAFIHCPLLRPIHEIRYNTPPAEATGKTGKAD